MCWIPVYNLFRSDVMFTMISRRNFRFKRSFMNNHQDSFPRDIFPNVSLLFFIDTNVSDTVDFRGFREIHQSKVINGGWKLYHCGRLRIVRMNSICCIGYIPLTGQHEVQTLDRVLGSFAIYLHHIPLHCDERDDRLATVQSGQNYICKQLFWRHYVAFAQHTEGIFVILSNGRILQISRPVNIDVQLIFTHREWKRSDFDSYIAEVFDVCLYLPARCSGQ